ncbi:MAG: regulatory signaling modulator protein AmpE [Gammaproteobacteria bacterium]|nr:regulatory signaling modulator protein AmpE [Gammaproteobacteria bacterium]MCY4256317.1 regulatory signaling modulator protein AmpE [Gammaproteobacteria bacterium]
MKLIALLIGIYAERFLARWSHLREFRPFEEQANRLAEKALGLDARAAPCIIAGMTLACAVPVGIVAWLLSDSSLEILWFVFAVAVLLASFGPRDLKAEALDYHQKAEAGDNDGAKAQAELLLGGSAPEDSAEQAAAVERATYQEANNRIFGVVFWFLVAGSLGPAFAFGFRALNSLRRYTATLEGGEALHRAAVMLHGLAAWVPARITSASFALAGNFDDAINAWRDTRANNQSNLSGGSNAVLGAVGAQALGARQDRVRGAVALVERSLFFVWGPIVAVAVILGWVY